MTRVMSRRTLLATAVGVAMLTASAIAQSTGTLEGAVPDAFFVTGPYEQAKRKP